MIKLTNNSTANISIDGANLAPGKSRCVENIGVSIDRLIQSGALSSERVVKVTPPAPKVTQPKPFQSFKSKEKN